jgi:hypothetical protein
MPPPLPDTAHLPIDVQQAADLYWVLNHTSIDEDDYNPSTSQ